ncbi:MAG: HAD hydrolase-like protein [Acidobacteriota bacterium]|nr:HAD hydrolase-like protein [Acidobacteriota bacterium]
MRKLVLFDIDGTLVLTGGAGLRAMNTALQEVFGHANGLDGIALAGRTDWAILSDAARRIGRSLDGALLADLEQRYVTNLAEEIQQPGTGRKQVLPGIPEILVELESREDVFVGLVTGNFEAGARVKLGHFDLWRYFTCGAFGGDAADRNALVPFALERARACGLPDIADEHILVIGDTPHDITCAHAAGAIAVGVATGTSPVEELRAAGAEHVFEDLGDTAAFLRLLD